jgi:N-glycosylase/DNA lyase
VKSFSLYAPNFNLAHTLECGQVFRWDKVEKDEYEGVLGGSIVNIRQVKQRLFVNTSSQNLNPLIVRSYFDLTLDLPCIYNRIGKDKYIQSVIAKFKGLRVIRQPLWECLASFIISAYNNIPRIKGIIYNLCRCSGSRLVLGERVNYSFPAPQVFANFTLRRLKNCGTGFRASYLKKAAQAFLNGKISTEILKVGSYSGAKDRLMQLDGVGQKVADCVLLYSIGRLEAFPVDVWIKRIMQTLYFNGKETNENKIREFAGAYFGGYAGYAQQYLYHYGRSEKTKIK